MKRTMLMAVLVYTFGVWPTVAQDREMRTIANTFAETLSKLGKKNVAVVDFTDLQGNVTELGRYLAEQMSVALALTDKGIDVVDRTHLRAVVQENKLSASGLIDPATALKLGQLAGVQVLVTGTLTPFGDRVELAVKALDAATARILGASTTDVAKTKAVEDLLNRDITNPGAGSSVGVQTAASPAVSGRGGFASEMEEVVFVVNSCRLTGSIAWISPDRWFLTSVAVSLSSHPQQPLAFQPPQGATKGRRAETGASVTCTLQLTNKGADRVVVLGGQTDETRIIDQSGRVYGVARLGLGAQQCQRCNVSSSLVNEVPILAGASFANIAADISRIALLELRYRIGSGAWHTVQIRDIPVSNGSAANR